MTNEEEIVKQAWDLYCYESGFGAVDYWDDVSEDAKRYYIAKAKEANSIKSTNQRPKSDTTKYTSIVSDDGRYNITANLKNGKYYHPMFEVFDHGKSVYFADNYEYILETILPCLKGEIGYKELSDGIPLKDFELVLSMFEDAIDTGFFGNLN